MGEEFLLDIIAVLNKQATRKKIKDDLKGMDNSMYVKVISKLSMALSQRQLKKDLKQLNDLYLQVGADIKIDGALKKKLQGRIKTLQDSISDLQIGVRAKDPDIAKTVTEARNKGQRVASRTSIDFNIEVKKEKAIADLEYMAKKYSKLFSNASASSKYNNILDTAYGITDAKQLANVRARIAAFTSELKTNNLASQSLGDKWKSLIDRAKDLFSAASAVSLIFSQVKQAVSSFLQLDTAMTNLYKVQDQITSRDQFSGLLTKWNKLAQNLAVTTNSLISSMEAWSKIGFNLDMSEQLAKITSIFEKTAEISNEKATSTLISAAQAFTEIDDLGVDDYVKRVEAVGNKINAIGNKYAIDSEGISVGLQNASAALKVAGNDLNETIALIAATNKIYQEPSESSNMLKVASMRLRGQVDALEAMGEDAEGVSTDLTKIQQQVYQLTGNKVNIFEDDENLKSTYQMILEIGEVFDSLNDRSQADLLEVMFGKQRASAGASLLLNYEELEKIKNDSINSANSMAEEYSKYMESAEAHITIFKEKLIETYSTFMSGDVIKYTADMGSGLLDLVNAADLLRHSLVGIVSLNVGKGITSIGASIASTAKQFNTLGNALQQVKNLPVDKALRKESLQDLGEATKNLTEKNLKLLLSQKQLEETDRIIILGAHDLTQEEVKLKLETMGLTTVTNANTAANTANAGSANILKGAFTRLTASVKATWAAMSMLQKASIIFAAISTVWSIGSSIISRIKQNNEELIQSTKEAADVYKESASSIEDYASRYEELHKALIAAKGNEEETYAIKKQLLELQTELNNKFGEECGTLDLVTNAYESQTEAIRNLNKEKAQLFLNENKKGIDKAEKEMTKDRHYNLSLTGVSAYTDEGAALKEIAEKYADQGVTLLDELGDGSYAQFSVHLDTDAQSAYDTINAFENDLRDKAKELGDEHMFEDVLDMSSDSLNKAKETIENYGDIYKQALIADIVSDDDKSKTYGEALKAVEAYNEAVLKSENPYDDQNVTQAKENLDAVKASIQGNEEEWGKYSVLLDDVFGQADTRLLEFNEALKTDDGLKGLANDLDGLNDIDLQALDENVGKNNSFDKLKKAAEEYDVSASELIDTLVRLGYVQGEIQSANLVDVNEKASFDQAWADSFTSENDKVRELGDTLLGLAEKGRLTKETFNEADSNAGNYFRNLNISADEAVSKINKLVDESSQLSSMSSQISSMANALGTKQENGFVEADTLSGFDVEVRGLESWDRFQEVLGSTTSSYEECQEAANALATEWVNSSDFLAQLTEQNEEYYKTQLKAMGIENYEEVISYAHALNEAKEVLSQSSLELGNATYDEIEALIAEGTYSELTANMILALYDAKIAEQAATIDTSTDCANLIALAGDTDRTSQSIQLLIQLMNIYSGLESGVYNNNAATRTAALVVATGIKAQLEALANSEVKDMEINPDIKLGSKGKSSAGKAGKDAGKTLKDALKEELSDLDSVISGITGRIDDQISSINEQKSAALDAIDAQKEALEEAKDAAVEALEAERDARLEVIETQKEQLEEQIKLIDKQIKAKQDEIDAINDAADARAREITLQEKQYALEQKRNQRTKLVYTESSGMIYRPDEQGIRKAKEAVDDAKRQIEIGNIQKEIDLLEDQKDLLNEQIDLLDERADAINKYYDEQIKQTENFYNSQLKNLEKQRKSTESYFESIIKNLENSKSKFQELTEILEKAELSAKLKQLGIDEEALLNGSEEEFNKLKDAYMNIVTQLNSGNDEVLSSLRELSGYEGTAPAMLENSNTELNTMKGNLDTSNQSIGSVNSSLGETAAKTSDVATNVGELESGLSTVNGLVTEEQTSFNNLKEKIDEVISKIREKTSAIQEEQQIVGGAVSSEMADFLLLKGKIDEVQQSIGSIGDTINQLDSSAILKLLDAFQLLYNKLILISITLGAGIEGTEDGAVGGITSAIQALNKISMEEGIITQFNNLKAAIDGVVSAISGGGASGDSASGASGEGKESSTGGSAGGLVGAIEDIKSATDKALGGGGGEGSGGEDGEGKGSEGGGTGAIGQFEQLKTAVDNVTTSIGSEGNEGTEGENSDTLIGSIDDLGESVTDTLGEPGGEGAIGRFEKFKEPIQEAETHVKGIYKGLKDIDGEEVECTIKVNIELSGSTGFTGSAQVLGSMNLESAEYNAKYAGNAHYEGTAEVTGDWGVKQGGETFVGELGQELVVFPNGRFRTIGDNGAEFVNIPAGSIVFNHLQTRELLSKGNIVGRGRMLATGSALASGTADVNGTIDDEWFILPNGERVREIRTGDRAYELQKAFEPLLKRIDGNLDILTTNANARYDKDMTELEKHVTNNVNNVTNKNVQPVVNNINVTCPGVTEQQVAERLGSVLDKELDKKFSGFYNYTDQMSRIR